VPFSGCGLTAFAACLHVVKEAAENGFAADFGSVSGDGAQFSMLHCRGNYCAIAIWCL
jgi:hypothetical protein